MPWLLDSLGKQDFKDYEIIRTDAGSKDKTVEIAKNYGCKIIPGGLPSKGRNEGAKVAKGDLLLFLDADLILPEGFLNTFLKYLLVHLYMALFGPIKSDIFKYRFNHYSKSKKINPL